MLTIKTTLHLINFLVPQVVLGVVVAAIPLIISVLQLDFSVPGLLCSWLSLNLILAIAYCMVHKPLMWATRKNRRYLDGELLFHHVDLTMPLQFLTRRKFRSIHVDHHNLERRSDPKNDFCRGILSLSRRTADRITSEDAVIYRFSWSRKLPPKLRSRCDRSVAPCFEAMVKSILYIMLYARLDTEGLGREMNKAGSLKENFRVIFSYWQKAYWNYRRRYSFSI